MQLDFSEGEIFLAREPIDFRKSINGISLLVIGQLQKEPKRGIYIFYNRGRNRVKILGWQKNGFVLVYKRLERGKFFVTNNENFKLDIKQLELLLLGVDWRLFGSENIEENTYF